MTVFLWVIRLRISLMFSPPNEFGGRHPFLLKAEG